MSEQNSISDFLDNVKGNIEASSDALISEAVDKGVKNLSAKISKVEVELPEPEKDESDSDKPASKVGTELADRAIETYKTKLKPPTEAGKDDISGAVDSKEIASTKAQKEHMKAIARSLAGMRNAGDEGKPAPRATPSGSGSTGAPGPQSYATLSMEEYKEHIFSSFGLEEGKKKDDTYLETDPKKRQKNNEKARKDLMKGPQMKNPHFEEVNIVATFEEALLALESRDWMSVDKVTREICEEHGITVKELNRDFKLSHGQYPDKWIREQVEVEECGWMPLDEASRINKVGMVYDVTFMFRGSVTRFKFFWPTVSRPSNEDMQKAVEGFYPRARLITYYPSSDQGDNYMVVVPPMTEHYVAYTYGCWEELSEGVNETLHLIAEEVGEPIASVEKVEEGYAVLVADHDTGEEKLITFEEDWQKTNRNDKTDGMSQKAVNAYKRENPGSKLKTAVTEKNPSGKRAGRRKSFCSRSNGQRKMHNIDCSKTPEKKICKARSRWNC